MGELKALLGLLFCNGLLQILHFFKHKKKTRPQKLQEKKSSAKSYLRKHAFLAQFRTLFPLLFLLVFYSAAYYTGTRVPENPCSYHRFFFFYFFSLSSLTLPIFIKMFL
uniref:Uncharacterized protein n=1 Tax=Cacopsylla melanoneura TaxID=428564 RepID=A0A8D9BLE5_9HEMI